MKRVRYGNIRSGDKRIQTLISALNQDSLNPTRLEMLVSSLVGIDERITGDRTERAKAIRLLDVLNELLSCYWVFPQIVNLTPERTDSKAWRLKWFWTEEQKRECGRVKQSGECFEMDSVITVFDLAVSQRISRLRKCKHCSKWLFARVAGQVFCSTECKDKYHGSNEEDKARRAAWARSDYQSRKKAKGKARKGA